MLSFFQLIVHLVLFLFVLAIETAGRSTRVFPFVAAWSEGVAVLFCPVLLFVVCDGVLVGVAEELF